MQVHKTSKKTFSLKVLNSRFLNVFVNKFICIKLFRICHVNVLNYNSTYTIYIQ